MPPDAISVEEPLKPSQTHYALVKLDETARSITQAIDELPILRAKLAKAASVKPRAREIYDDMRKLHAKGLLQNHKSGWEQPFSLKALITQ